MEISMIKTEAEYTSALEAIDNLLNCSEGSKEEEKLEILSILVEAYEAKHYAIY